MGVVARLKEGTVGEILLRKSNRVMAAVARHVEHSLYWTMLWYTFNRRVVQFSKVFRPEENWKELGRAKKCIDTQCTGRYGTWG